MTHAVHERFHQIVFASEIPVEARDTAAHGASEMRHAERIQALVLDDPGRRVEDVVPVQRATGTTGATHRVTRHKRTVVIVCITGSVIVCITKTKSSTSLISLRRKREGEDQHEVGHRLRQHHVSRARPRRSRWRRPPRPPGSSRCGAPSTWWSPVGEGVTPVRRLARREDGPAVEARRHPRPARSGWPSSPSQTSTIQLGTNVVIVPEHQPAVLAKSVATLDALSGGRVQLGIGVGELPEEYARRGHGVHQPRQADGRVHRGDARCSGRRRSSTYHGEYVQFDQVRCDPSPVNGTVPIHIGGASPAALRRAARVRRRLLPVGRPAARLRTPRCAR